MICKLLIIDVSRAQIQLRNTWNDVATDCKDVISRRCDCLLQLNSQKNTESYALS